jgi:hypothetical protein
LNLATLQQFFEANPGRFTFDPLATRADSLVQDFQADETVAAGIEQSHRRQGHACDVAVAIRGAIDRLVV